MSRVVARLGVIFAVLAVFFAVLLLPSFILVSLQKNEILRQVEFEEANPLTHRVNEVDGRVDKANKQILGLKNNLLGQDTLFSMLSAVLADSPEGVSFQHFIFDRGEKTLSLAGKAKTRASVLELDTRLKKLPLAEKVELPLASLVRETDTDFTIRILLKL